MLDTSLFCRKSFSHFFQFNQLIKTLNMIYTRQKAIFLGFLMKKKIIRIVSWNITPTFFCTCLIHLILINSFFRYFSQQSILCIFLISKCWCLLYDICSPADIFVCETKIFSCRLVMWNFFSRVKSTVCGRLNYFV